MIQNLGSLLIIMKWLPFDFLTAVRCLLSLEMSNLFRLTITSWQRYQQNLSSSRHDRFSIVLLCLYVIFVSMKSLERNCILRKFCRYIDHFWTAVHKPGPASILFGTSPFTYTPFPSSDIISYLSNSFAKGNNFSSRSLFQSRVIGLGLDATSDKC